MIVSVAALTVRKGHRAKAVEIIQQHVEKEKKAAGVVKAYFKKALNNDDTFLIYVEYDSKRSFATAEKVSQKLKQDQKVEFAMRPHLLRGFYGNFE